MPAPTPTDIPPDGLPRSRRRWAALAIWIAIAVTILDGSIANMALSVIAAELRQPAASVIWIVNAYQVAILAVLLTARAWARCSAIAASICGD